MAWDQRFYDRWNCRDNVSRLRDGAEYIIKLPKADRELPQCETMIEVLMLIGEHGGDPMMPHIAMMKAPQRHRAESGSGTAPESCQGPQGH